MSVLITGGAGYIGSHMAHLLREDGEQFVVIDNLSTGVKENLPANCTFIKGDCGDSAVVSEIFSTHAIDSVIHFSGSVVVPESVERPLEYYHNNTAASRCLIETSIRHGVRNFIFSSTAAVYGESQEMPVRENSPTVPISPYGRSKLATEWILEDAGKAHAMRTGILRYFNVAGADPRGRTGQSTPRATHLIKRACEVATGKAAALTIFGDDYETKDGTGVRDYIHVSDLVAIHASLLSHLRNEGQSVRLNCGYGRGFSVREVIASVERISCRALKTQVAPRRPGDMPIVVADNARLLKTLDWTPQYADLDTIVGTALAWEGRTSSAGS